MNTKSLLTTAALVHGCISISTADKIRFDQAPRQVQETIRAEAGAAAAEDIDKQVRNGQTFYEVGFKKGGQHQELLLNELGQSVHSDGSLKLDSRKIAFNDLPEAVKRTVRFRAGRTGIEDVDRVVKDGQATYEISFKRGGKQQELLVSQEGRILRDIEDTGIRTPPIAESEPAKVAVLVNLQPKPIEISGGRRVQLDATPAAVRSVILNRAGGATVEDLELGVWNSQPVYQAAFKANGKHIELQVADDGRIIHDPRLSAAEGIGRSAGAVTGRGASEYDTIIQPVLVGSAQKLQFNELPLRVQSTLKEQLGAAIIEDLEMGSWQGRTVYEAAFKWNGQHLELQLDDEGRIIFDPRTQLNK